MAWALDLLGLSAARAELAGALARALRWWNHVGSPEDVILVRIVADPATHDALKQSGREVFWGSLEELDGLIAGKEWFAGSQYTVCDPYALVFYGWGKRIELPVQELKNLSAWKDRMVSRTAVRTVLDRENSILLPATAAA